ANLGGDFEAVDHFGNTVTQDDVITGPTLIYFGYTFCPDVCPLDTARNAKIVDLVAEQGISLRPVFVTVDPERDTAEALADHLSYVHPDMIGITGTPEQIETLKKAYRVFSTKTNVEDEFYLVDHSAFSYLVTPNGFVTGYDRALTEEQVADNIACHVENGDL
ncbi:UNVERIFIED_CONTAM: hypothetical protein GTU68_008335, partial [Idotea baltica]|nr:hypothetical protein [Idotea baltica]